MTLLLRLALLIYVAGEVCHSYHYNSKTDYTNPKWRYPTTSYRNTWRRNSYHVTEKPHRIRHSGTPSRFNRLDQVMYRLDNYFMTTKKPRVGEHDSKTSSVESLLSANSDGDDYKDDDFDDDVFDDDDDPEDDTEDNDTDYNDEDIVDDDEVQAEEASNHHESPITSYKWNNYGTQERVDRSRQRMMHAGPENESDLAIKHFIRVQKAMGCSTPVPKVLSIQKEHPNPGRTYIPHCTILHRCSEDTGCCHDPSKQCGPTNQTIVQLYFYVNYQGHSKVEKLAFSNHTKCGCLEKSAINVSQIHYSDSINAIVPSSNLRSGTQPENLRRCKCPMEYTPGYRYNQCICTCPEDSIDCDRMKKGKEYFSLKDRLCIKNGQCSAPSCEYGNYLKDVGRCPKKQEK